MWVYFLRDNSVNMQNSFLLNALGFEVFFVESENFKLVLRMKLFVFIRVFFSKVKAKSS